MMSKVATTGQRLKEIMNETGMKQVDILNKSLPFQKSLEISMGKSALSQYVNDVQEPDQQRIYLLAQTLDVNEAWLMGYNVNKIKIDAETYIATPSPTTELPYYGTVSAGGFEYASVDPDLMQVPTHLIKDNNSYFILKTNGDSMNKVIANGHYVIVQDIRDGNYTLKNNDILIFKSGSEYTMKRVRKTDTMLHLEPDSYINEFETQSFEINDCLDVEIIGKVIYSFREFN
ncbi:LexA family protein [Globicatella sp. PHS-GS-PNBC-21-1553]|uniref:LexA family protein n=1 Tax=Globicatella sp. PHS-GS-PNBC-21-1553 TaxID=2885764 RepID=UPI00298EFCC9|nr:S24 family peptidase [Globicatella sp. PHS-GS-PNBC-21-1553]WPC07975.1 helix-turn-helix domain-containing protein [Globicatella sp. PHS-GS-PNBC-21-1553]